MPRSLQKIISGGQTGVDRGALDAAIELNLPHGGWCPRGRKAEDGTIPPQYQLSETASARYAERTERNVLDSDGTLILVRGQLGGGTALTQRLAQQHGKPCLVVRLDQPLDLPSACRWLDEHQVAVLNVPGPRESENPGIWAEAKAFIVTLAKALLPTPSR